VISIKMRALLRKKRQDRAKNEKGGGSKNSSVKPFKNI
jgi:hypothetical protein